MLGKRTYKKREPVAKQTIVQKAVDEPQEEPKKEKTVEPNKLTPEVKEVAAQASIEYERLNIELEKTQS